MTEYTFPQVLDLKLELEPARFGLMPEDLFALAVRKNPKRSFLFVSRVLGKHLPIRPQVLPAAGKLLALACSGGGEWERWAGVVRGTDRTDFPTLMEALATSRVVLPPEERTLFVGFAETATGLARAVAACYDGAWDYLSTTRLPLDGWDTVYFEESHSHAKTHLLHVPPELGERAGWIRAVLVDDELTTGNTALKLVEALHRRFGIRRFTLLTLLDWTDGANREELARRLGVEIELVSLLHGRIVGEKRGTLPPFALDDCREWPGTPIAPQTLERGGSMGRTLLTPRDQAECEAFCRRVARSLGPAGEDTLFLGAGELIYEPALIAGYCGASAFHSTTQSPVYPLTGSAVTCGVQFQPPDGYSAAGYLYNVPQGCYRRVVLLAEQASFRAQGAQQLMGWLAGRGMEQQEVVLL